MVEEELGVGKRDVDQGGARQRVVKRGEASREPSAVGKRTRVSRSRVQKAVPLRLAAEDSSKQNEPHQLHAKHDDEAGGDNCGLQIQRQREVGGGLEKFEEGGHAAIRQEGVRRPITLNGTMSADAKPAGDVSAPPRRWPTGDSFAPAPSQHSGLPPRSQAAASASRCCGPPRGRGFSLSFGWEAMQRLRPIFVIGSPYCPLPEVLCDHRPSA